MFLALLVSLYPCRLSWKLCLTGVFIWKFEICLNIFNQVDLSWHVAHKYSKKSFPEDVVPIIVSNMDTTGTFTMAKEIGKVAHKDADHISVINIAQPGVEIKIFLYYIYRWNSRFWNLVFCVKLHYFLMYCFWEPVHVGSVLIFCFHEIIFETSKVNWINE